MPANSQKIELKLVISVLDKTSKTLNKIAEDVHKIAEGNQKAGTTGEKAWKQTDKAASRYQKRLNRLQDEYRKLSQQSTRYWSTMKGVAAITAAGGASAIFPVKAAAEFERAMSRVVAVTTGAAGRYEELSQKAKELGRDTLYTSTQAAEGMKFLGMTGLNAAEAIGAIGPALDLATLGEMELAKAADYATNIMMGFDKSVEDLSHIIDVMAHAAANSNQSVTELADAMSYVAPVANAAGVGLEQATAAIGMLSDRGIKASRAGTALRGVIASLTDPTEEALGSLQKMGVQIQYNTDGTLNLLQTLEELNRANLQSGDAFRIFRRTAAAAAQAMTSNVDQMRAFSETLSTGVDGAAKQFRQQLEDNLIGQLIKLQAAFNNLMIEVGEPFIHFMTELTKSVSAWLSTAAEWAEENEKTVVLLGKVAGAITALTAVVLVLTTAMWALTKAKQAYLTVGIGMLNTLQLISGGFGGFKGEIAKTTANLRNNSIVLAVLSKGYHTLAGAIGLSTLRTTRLTNAIKTLVPWVARLGAMFVKGGIAFGIGYAIGTWINSFKAVQTYVQSLIADFDAFYHEVAAMVDKLILRWMKLRLAILNANPLASESGIEALKEEIRLREERIKGHQRSSEIAQETKRSIQETAEAEKEAAKDTTSEYEKQQKLAKQLEKETRASADLRMEYAQKELDQFVNYITGKKNAEQEYAAFQENLQKELAKKQEELQELEIEQKRATEQELGLAQESAAKTRVENTRQEISQIEKILASGVDEYVSAEEDKTSYMEGSLKDRLGILKTHLSEAKVQYEKGSKERIEVEQAVIPEIERIEDELAKRKLKKVQDRYNLYSNADAEYLESYKKVIDSQLNYVEGANNEILWMSNKTYSSIRDNIHSQEDALTESYRQQLKVVAEQEGKQIISHEEGVRKRQLLEEEYNRRRLELYDELLQYAITTYGENSEEYNTLVQKMIGYSEKFANATIKSYDKVRDDLIKSMTELQDELAESIQKYSDKINDVTSSMVDRNLDLEDKIADIRRQHMGEEQRYQSLREQAIEKQTKAEQALADLRQRSQGMSQEDIDRQLELIRRFAADSESAYTQYSRKSTGAADDAISGLRRVNQILDQTDKYEISSFEKLKQGAEDALTTVEKWVEEFNRRVSVNIKVNVEDLQGAVAQINSLIPDESKHLSIDVPEKDIKKINDTFDKVEQIKKPKKMEVDVDSSRIETELLKPVEQATQTIVDLPMAFREGLGELSRSFKDEQGRINEIWEQGAGQRMHIIRNEAGQIIGATDRIIGSINKEKQAVKEVETARDEEAQSVQRNKDEIAKIASYTEDWNQKVSDTAEKQREVSDEVARTVQEVKNASETTVEKSIRIVLENFEEVKNRVEEWANREIEKIVNIKVREQHAAGGRAGELSGIFKMNKGGRFPGDSKKDSIHVMARPGEGFVNNEALSVWDKMFGTGFFHGINAPWSDAGQSIINALKGNLSVSLPDLQKSVAPKFHFAEGGRTPSSSASTQDMGKIVFEVSGNGYPVYGDVEVLSKLQQEIKRKQRLRMNS